MVDIVRVRIEIFMVKNAVAKFGGILAEALQSLRYRQCAGQSVDHAVPGELDPVLQVDIGIDKICKAARYLTTFQQSPNLLRKK